MSDYTRPMDEEFKMWIMERFAELDCEQKKSLFLQVRSNPRTAQETIRDYLRSWGREYCQKMGRPVMIRFDRDPLELLVAVRDRFQDEIDSIAA